MRFTTQDFIEGSLQTPSSTVASHHSNDEFSSRSMQGGQDSCYGYCSHSECRAYSPIPREPRETHHATFTPLSQMSIYHIFLLHVGLSDLQDSIDASQELMSVMDEDVFTEIHDSNSSTSLAYRTITRRRHTRFRRLLEEIRRSVAFFGYQNMPPRQQFVDAVRQAQLYNEEISHERLREWYHEAESLRSEFANESEHRAKNGHLYAGDRLPQWSIFQPDRGFLAKEKTGNVSIDEGVAPEDDGLSLIPELRH